MDLSMTCLPYTSLRRPHSLSRDSARSTRPLRARTPNAPRLPLPAHLPAPLSLLRLVACSAAPPRHTPSVDASVGAPPPSAPPESAHTPPLSAVISAQSRRLLVPRLWLPHPSPLSLAWSTLLPSHPPPRNHRVAVHGLTAGTKETGEQRARAAAERLCRGASRGVCGRWWAGLAHALTGTVRGASSAWRVRPTGAPTPHLLAPSTVCGGACTLKRRVGRGARAYDDGRCH